jgi:predicted RNA-binding Zn ribbon-like protein
MSDPDARHRAPEPLELVRRLLNTWDWQARTHQPRDLLVELMNQPAQFRQVFGVAPPRRRADRAELVALRDDLRLALGSGGSESALLNRWLERIPLRPVVDGVAVRHRATAPGLAGRVLAATIDGMTSDGWSRLKACDDCRYVFYDHTRNHSRRWCMMSVEGPGGRSCGSIAKVRRYRARKRARPSTTGEPPEPAMPGRPRRPASRARTTPG